MAGKTWDKNWHDIENYETHTPVILPLGADVMTYAAYWWGHSDVYLTDEHIDALKKGHAIIFADGEYSHEIRYKPSEEKGGGNG